MESTTTASAPLPPHQLHSHFTPMTTHPHSSPSAPPSAAVTAAAAPLMSGGHTLAAPMSGIAKPTNDSRITSWPDTPTADKRIDHALPSNLRDSAGNTLEDLSAHDDHTFADPGFTKPIFDMDPPDNDQAALQTTAAKEEPAADDFSLPDPTTPSKDTTNYADTATLDTNDEPRDEETSQSIAAYAMLRFPDSFCLITSLNLVIVRDENYRARYLMQKKEDKKRRKAVQAVEEYAREPSHKSLRGDDDAVASLGPADDEGLEGRPMISLLSNYSETGGAVSYPALSEDEADFEEQRSKRRRKKNKANSSSANSVAPQDLSIFGGNGDEGEFLPTGDVVDENGIARDSREWAQLPVHTARPEDIGKISREHLIFSYDMNRQLWVLNVTGRGVVVNAVFHPKGCEAIELNHQDEIFVSTVRMIFELPNRQDEESVADVDDDFASRYGLASTSPVRSSSNVFDNAGSEADDQEQESQLRAPKPVRIKLTNKRKDAAKDAVPAHGKIQGKDKGKSTEQAKVDASKSKSKADPSASPEICKKPDKGKKPKAAPADAPGETAPDETEQSKAESAAPPVVPVIDPGSVLADLAPEQMPEKRKGPGRPPKNGLLSKRDESAIKRKQREYERRGEQAPELQTLLNIVRAEQRAKDLAAKAHARGEAAPDTPIPSIETDARNDSGAGPSGAHKDSIGGISGSPANAGDRASPKPIRRPKSPSPIKPESEFTEDDMKKPNMTYIYIIDEILQNMEGSQADLQTIYDKIQKRWPYYKYRVSSVGWQSSVRHNLLQCDRFKEAGKSGKGRFWTINFDHPLDNKKKRPTPPPRPPQQVVTNGLPHMPQSQYGQPGYPPGYGQTPVHGAGTFPPGPQPGQGQYYSSPYQQNMYAAGPHRAPSNGPYMQHGHPQTPQNRPPPQTPAPAPPPFQRVVEDIVSYRTRYLSQFLEGSETYSANVARLDRGISYYSDRFHGTKKEDDSSVCAEEAAMEPFSALKAIFDKHKALEAAATQLPAGAGLGSHSQAPAPPLSVANQQAVLSTGAYQQPLPPGASVQGQQSMGSTDNRGNASVMQPPSAPQTQHGHLVHAMAAPPSASYGPQNPSLQAMVPPASQQVPNSDVNGRQVTQSPSTLATPQHGTVLAAEQPKANAVTDNAAIVLSNGTQEPVAAQSSVGVSADAAAPGVRSEQKEAQSSAQPVAVTGIADRQEAPAKAIDNHGNSESATTPQAAVGPSSSTTIVIGAAQRSSVPLQMSQAAGFKRAAERDGREKSEDPEAKRQKTS